MRRRLPSRVWHALAAFVPLPLIGLGYVAAVPGNLIAFEIELYLAGKGSAYERTLPRAGAESVSALPQAAAQLFSAGRKGPRADQYLVVMTTTYAGKQRIAASVMGTNATVAALFGGGMISRDRKGDRLKPTISEAALKGPIEEGLSAALFMSSPLNSDAMDYETSWNDAMPRPKPESVAYRPTPKALNFRYQGESQAEFEERERRCLATAIYFEARGEPVRGQIAVGQVIMNRVRSPLFPETICGVVYQGQMQRGCQFSFACDGHTDTPKNNTQWELAQELSRQITSGQEWLPEVGYSTFYHADYVRPGWARKMNKIDSIGRHVFYKKRNEAPYVVQASATEVPSAVEPQPASGGLVSSAISLVSTAADTTSSPTPAMSLGFSASE